MDIKVNIWMDFMVCMGDIVYAKEVLKDECCWSFPGETILCFKYIICQR